MGAFFLYGDPSLYSFGYASCRSADSFRVVFLYLLIFLLDEIRPTMLSISMSFCGRFFSVPLTCLTLTSLGFSSKGWYFLKSRRALARVF